MKDRIDHKYTANAVCPYCGYVHLDSWEIPDEWTEHTCHRCSRDFGFERIITVTYSTYKLEEVEGE